ncbi:hypothetical protein J1N35_002812 [Gossypium stocksii]|uniref:Retrotransposon Copia-like N-terminal domain-containing protein n=1 Tax=Gossypium stocksii TaxID=47602 RepID=A0A9D4AP13_9ROSI|nr:hypothetical protein J1N35_002812 [Gossypium stocksii]
MAIDNSLSKPLDPNNPLTTVTIQNSIKLNSTNYLSWKTQIKSILIGYDLFKFIDGTHPCQPKIIITNDTTSINPAYQTWLRQDKLLFGALVGTISQNLILLILRCTTLAETLTILANTYARHSILGSETRRTKTHIPDPYGIEIGNLTKIPSGFVETWGLNIHVINIRGVEDRMGCTEYRCDLYNVINEENGTPLSPNYDGGLLCCYDRTKSRLKDGFIGIERNLYLQYTVKWVYMNSLIVLVNVYIFDVSDIWKRSRNSTRISSKHNYQVEYQVKSCRATGSANDKCIDVENVSLDMPFGGYLVYGVAHQHAGGTSSALYGKDGRSLCSSIPVYGTGEEAGNENGYIVGMSTCYSKPGTKKISKGETLILESNYSSIKQHTGVMGLFYILVAETLA